MNTEETELGAAKQGLARVLGSARRRMALLNGGRRAGWLLLLGVVVLELGWVLRGALPLGGSLILTLGALLLATACGALLVSPLPSPVLAGEVLDVRLATGATIACGAEALGGAHGRFASALIREAQRAVSGARLREVLPLRVPIGVVLGLGAAVLFPFVVPVAGTANAAQAPQTRLRSLLDLGAPAGGGGEDSAPSGENGWVLVPTPPTEAPEPEVWDALPLDVAEDVRAQLESLLADLPAAGGSSGGEGDAGGGSGDGALDAALASRDLARIRNELERLTAAAGAGDAAAAASLETLRDGLAPPGAGSGEAGESTEPAPADPVVPTGGDVADSDKRLPWALEEACRRYFR